ncbi:hypothetical protein [Fonticella tunisiensis]|uniref:Uncharacterized protein n=1 Tax=Fonticella tunisiensis TaxID=1096341 RepID=A0A4R7KRY8_9CLOT|nr:hypothetical protein [Fonticella tunisiensis]TDT62365.1 hypothetical protein EDD71_10490 [Fonticella tunisiensis]
MIVDASKKIAVKCSECGKYNIISTNFFEMKIPTNYRCTCGHKMFKSHINREEVLIDIDCIACERVHSYRFKLRDIIEKPITIIGCPSTGMEIAFLGKDRYVDDVVQRYMDDMFELLKALGIIGERAAK